MAIKVVLQAEKAVEVTTLTVIREVDIPGKREVRVWVKELPLPVIIWQGKEYDLRAEAWTETELQKRLAEIVASGEIELAKD